MDNTQTHTHDFTRICNTVEQSDHSLNVYYECNVGYCQSLKKQVFTPKGEATIIIMPERQV